MKKTIAILISLMFFVTIGGALAATEITPLQQLLSFTPTRNYACYSNRLIFSTSGTVEGIAGAPNTGILNLNINYPYNPQCAYKVIVTGTVVGNGDGRVNLIFGPQYEIMLGRLNGTETAQFYWNPENGVPTQVGIQWRDLRGYEGEPPDLFYEVKIYSECPCEKTVLYPKVDIEQFSVTGGATIIKDGKILSSFNITPGVQQTFIQVENRGFFTQNDARVKFMGLPEGVTVKITPETQKLKAHNIGTYSAEFTVGPNVPSGTYDVTMVAYSSTGTFDVIQFKFVVP